MSKAKKKESINETIQIPEGAPYIVAYWEKDRGMHIKMSDVQSGDAAHLAAVLLTRAGKE